MHGRLSWLNELNPETKEKKMKTRTTAIAILILLMAWGCAQQATSVKTGQSAVAAEQQFYTAYNIWRIKSHNMKCINYKLGHNILPAGTLVAYGYPPEHRTGSIYSNTWIY